MLVMQIMTLLEHVRDTIQYILCRCFSRSFIVLNPVIASAFFLLLVFCDRIMAYLNSVTGTSKTMARQTRQLNGWYMLMVKVKYMASTWRRV